MKVSLENREIQGILTWMQPKYLVFLLSACYPGILFVFSSIVGEYGRNEPLFFKIIAVLGAVVMMALIFAIPILAVKTLSKIGHQQSRKIIASKRIIHLVFATYPFYTLLLLMLFQTGMGHLSNIIWPVLMLLLGIAFYYYAKPSDKSISGLKSIKIWGGWRLVHGIAALLFLLGFVLLHIFNHGLALWSVELHTDVLEALRQWYASGIVEPVLFFLMGMLIISGTRLFLYHTTHNGDIFRTLQTTSGVYIFMFLCAHSMAVLGAQATGVETDWYFATGPSGLFTGPVMLFPYYTLAVFLILMHASLGLRLLLIHKKNNLLVANRIFYTLIIIAAIFSAGISIATTGIHLIPEYDSPAKTTGNQDSLALLIENKLLKIDPKLESDVMGFDDDHYLNILEVELAPLVTEPLHTHPGTEILYCLSGKGNVLVDGTAHNMEAGSIVYVNKGQKKALSNTDESTRFRVLAFLVLERNFPKITLCN
ncbi:cupin domain-containing protein [Fulvivirgaceae bacterium BMA12]|uniref:Cupin domain-containing protein n=1 Tax=Agaribacillus aureus TaxID=3051825 RepID=A0ABT8L2M4_9BACT|nr:cupin domain-containing protein [Fulvivirgaceae bacterium BMA12]